jgi:hypothetical protein
MAKALASPARREIVLSANQLVYGCWRRSTAYTSENFFNEFLAFQEFGMVISALV